MLDIALHIRIFAGSPTDDFVKKRQNAINDLATKFTKPNTLNRLLSVANGIALASKDGGNLPAQMAEEVAASIAKFSPSFVAEGNDLELSTCAMLAAFTAIQNGNKSGTLTVTDYLAVGIWSGMSWQPGSKKASFERLRKLLLDLSRDHVLKAAEVGRVRSKPASPVTLAEDNSNLGKVIANLRSVVDALTANAAVDREEIDLLWWSISGWSDLLQMKYIDAKPHTAAIALGLDAAKRLRRMPIDLHKALVLRRVPQGVDQTFPQLIKTLGEDCVRLGAQYGDRTFVTENNQVFPLLNVLASGSATGAGKRIFSISDLASMALLEAVTFDVLERDGV